MCVLDASTSGNQAGVKSPQGGPNLASPVARRPRARAGRQRIPPRPILQREKGRSLDLPFAARGRFEGRRGQTGPADFAIPTTGADALVAIGVKGYDSTGSKLTDAATEIETMAEVRKPTQFIFAVVDGHGWLRRTGDLRRIHALWTDNRIDGIYNLTTLEPFRQSLAEAARRLGLQ